MTTEHGPYCRKEGEISEIHADLKTVKKYVMGNGKDGLIVTVPQLSQNVEQLTKATDDFKTTLSGFIKFQQEQVGKKKGIDESKRRSRWIIGLLVTALLVITGALITTIHLLSQANAGG